MRDGCDQPCTKLSRSRIAHTVGMSAGCEHPPQHRSAFLEDDEHQHPVQQPTRRSRDCWQLLAARGEGDAVRQGCGPHVHITDMRTAQLRTASHDGQHPCNLHDSCEAASHANSQRNVSMRAPPQRARVILHAPSHIPPPATEFSWRSAYDADKSLRVAAPQVATGRIRRARFADLRCPAILACSFALMLGSVEGQAICATHSTARGLATTSATAGIPASFTIQSRDVYGLPLAPKSGKFVVSFHHEKGIHSFTSITHKEGGTVESVTISAGGSGCTANGTLAAKGGGGSGFAATFTLAGDAINAVTITNKGEGYMYDPTLWIDSGGAGCAGYILMPVMSPAGDFVGSAVTTVSGKYQVAPLLIEGSGLNASYFNNVWLHGEPALRRIDNAIDFDWGNGPITPYAADRASVRWEGVIQIVSGISQPVAGLRGGVRKVDVVRPGSSCSSDGTLAATGGGGSGFDASFTVAGYFSVDGKYATGIEKIIITNPGKGYRSPPALSIATGGIGCKDFRLDALLSSTHGMDTVFYAETDGGVKLWIDDMLVIDRWENEAFRQGFFQQCYGTNQGCSYGEDMMCRTSEAHSTIKSDAIYKVRTIISNSCPEYNQSFSAQAEFSTAVVQYWNIELPLHPTMSQIPTHVAKTGRSAVGVIGFAVNGVPFYGPMDDFSSSRKWSEEQYLYDGCNGHVDTIGIYHYHGNPTCLYGSDLSKHSPVIGFMLDGIPIHGPLDIGGVRASELTGASLLDECGGHTDAENVFYHYHVGSEKSHVVNCLMGCLQGMVYNGSNININTLTPCISSTLQYDYNKLSTFKISKIGTLPSQTKKSSLRTHSGQAYLEAGSFHKFKLEYVHQSGYAAMHFHCSPGIGERRIATDFFQLNGVKWCGDTVLCSQHIFTVQAGVSSAALSFLSPLENLKLDVVTPIFDDSYATALATLPKFKQPNYIAEAGNIVFTVTSIDEVGNVRFDGGDSFDLKILRHVNRGTLQEGSTAYVVLDSNSSSEDGAYNDHALETTEGAGSGQRVLINNYFGETLTATATFATKPDSSTQYVIGLEEDASVQPLGNGYYLARPQLTISSNYTLWVRLSGTAHIHGSPFHVHVGTSKFSAADSYVVWAAVWDTGNAETLYIVARDKFGNDVTGSSFQDSCTKRCSAVRFSAVIRSSIATSLVTHGRIAAAGDASHFMMASTASAFPTQYVGFAVNVGGETRNITHHGNAQGSSANEGRIITVNSAFAATPAQGDNYYVTKILDVKPRAMRICRMSDPDYQTATGINALALCPALLETGEYTIDVKSSGQDLSNSPLRILVRPSWKCATKSTASGMGLTLATAGVAATFTITTKDSYSQLSTNGGDGFSISADRGGAVTALQYFSYCAPSLSDCSISSTGIGTQTISDQDTGTYLVSLTPTKSGSYRISVKLGLYQDLFGSPYQLYVKPASFCASKSYALGVGLTLATSGMQSRFTVFAQDTYNNPVQFLDNNALDCVSSATSPGTCGLIVTVGDSVIKVEPRDTGIDVSTAEDPAAGWDVAYTIDKTFATRNYTTTLAVAGSPVTNILSGGLFATYYSDDALLVPVARKEDTAIDFSGDGVGDSAGVEGLAGNWPWKGLLVLSPTATTYANNNFSARWTGLIKPQHNYSYTFEMRINDIGERVRMWMDNTLIVDQWASLDSFFPTGTYHFDKDFGLYDIKVEYVERGADARKISLLWQNNDAGDGNFVPVPSDRLSRPSQAFTTLVIANRPSVALFATSSGDALSLSTAGVYSYFTVTARDLLQTIEAIDSKTQRIDFQGRTGREVGGLFATYYRQTDLSDPIDALTQRSIDFLTGNTTLARQIGIPTPADPAEIVVVVSAFTLGVTVGSDIYIDHEMMHVLSISSDTLNVLRGMHGTTIAPHLQGATVNTIPINGLNTPNGYSATWMGLVRPQYDELYTFTAKVAEADERIKLWIEDYLLVDAWSSISATTLTATWNAPSANGFYSVKVEYKELYGKDGCSLSWNSATRSLEVIPTDRLYHSDSMLHGEVVSTGDGTYRGRYITTLSGSYQTRVSINTAGGLAATYYSDPACIKYAYHRTDAEISFDWGHFSPHQSVPRDFFCARWAGMLAPASSEEYKFVLSADDSAKLWIDNELLIDHTVFQVESWAIKMLRKEYLYPIKVEYREQRHKAKVKLMWSSSKLTKTSISKIKFRDTSCSIRPDALYDCLGASASGVSAGSNFIDGNIIVHGGNPPATGTYTVDTRGSILSLTLEQGGSGYSDAVSFKDVDVLYNDTNTSQSQSVTSIKIENGGTGFLPGRFRVLGGNESDLCRGEFDTSGGRISKIFYISHGSGYQEFIDSSTVEIFFASNEEDEAILQTQSATVTSVAIGGTKTTSYTSDSIITVTCNAPCTGSGFVAKCSARQGTVFHVEIKNRGFGYSSTNPPTLACPGGAGQTFTPSIAGGAVLTPKVALGARLIPVLAGKATQIIPSSNLFGKSELIKGWSGSKDFHTLTLQPHVVCGSTSNIEGGGMGWSVSLSTVGFPATFTIVARDEYGNIRTGTESTTEEDYFVSRLVWNESSQEIVFSNTGSSDAGTIATSAVAGRYDFSVASAQQTTAGFRIMQTSLISQGGLSATYYTGSNYTVGQSDPFYSPSDSTPTKVQTDKTLDFSGASKTWPACLAGNGQYPFGARWSGFVRQTTGSSATYTFSFVLKHAAERVRLWLSNTLVLDQWSSLATLTPSMLTHATLTDSKSNSILVDYKSKDETRGITMKWTDSGGTATVVPSSRLFAQYDVVGGYRNEYVQGGPTAGDTLQLYGDAVSVATAFIAATFTIVARDRYSNPITNAEEFSIRLSNAQADAQLGVPKALGRGTFEGAYRVTLATTQTLSVMLPQLGGLHATYFTSDNFTNAQYIRIDSLRSASGSGDGTSETMWPGQPGESMAATQFSVRWEGFLKPPAPIRYQFKTNVADADDRVKLWIDNSLIINQWETLDALSPSGTFYFTLPNTLFDIKVEYKEKIGLHGLSLTWSAAPYTTVIIDDIGCNTGCWNSSAFVNAKNSWLKESILTGFFGTGYHQDGNDGKGLKEFWFRYPEAFGVYDVYVFYPANAALDSKVPLSVIHSGGTSLHYVDQTITAATGHFLGRYSFVAGADVYVSNAGTTQTVVADAIKFVKNVQSSDRILHCGQVLNALSAREFTIARSAIFTNTDVEYLNAYMWIGNEKGLIIKSWDTNRLRLDRSFSMGSTTLGAALSISSTSVSVTSAADAGIIVGRTIQVGTELMRVTAVSTNTITVERGYLSTVAIAYESGDPVITALIPGTMIDSGTVGTVTSSSVFMIATTAPKGTNTMVGFQISVAFGGFVQARTIVAYVDRNVTVSPAFDSIPVNAASLYTITAKCLFTITKVQLKDSQGADCKECPIPTNLFYITPRTQRSVLINRDLKRSIPAAPTVSLATAGIPEIITITVRDIYGTALSADPDSLVMLNGTYLSNTLGYGTATVASGIVATANDAYSFTLDGVAEPESGLYVGQFISIAGESRSIVEYTAARVVTVNAPFATAPQRGVSWGISSVQSTEGKKWFGANPAFVGSYCDINVQSNPCNITFLATTAGVYAVEVQLFRKGGMQANYYHNFRLQGSPSMTRVENVVNHDWGFGLVTNSAKDHVGVRWTGLVKATYTEVYTFITNVTGFGPVLTVDGKTLVDKIDQDSGCVTYDAAGGCIYREESFQWTFDFPSSGTENVHTSTVLMTAGKFYEISLTYKHRTGAASIQLWWTSTNTPLQIIPSTALYFADSKVPGSPFKLRVHPSNTMCSNNIAYDSSIRCTSHGSVGTLYGNGLTAVTAGTVATFNLQSKDQYGNVAENPGSPIVVRVDGNPSCGAPGSGRYYSGLCEPTTSVTPSIASNAGLFRYNFTAVTDSADSKISVSALEQGGLFATYYTELPCNEIMNARSKSASGVASVTLNTMGSSCTADGTLSATGGGPGTGFSAQFAQRGGSVDRIIVTNAGHGYDSVPTITCCKMIISIAITGTGSSYTNGGAATADCTGIAGCTGSGFAGTCVGDGAVVTSLTITNHGTGYSSTNPPAITCAGGAGHTFTPTIDTSTGGTGCLGARFTAVMQFENNYETLLATAPRSPNAWWQSDIGSSGAGLTKCALYTPYKVQVDPTVDFSGDSSAGSIGIATWPGTSAQSREGNWFAVRWAGFVKAPAAGVYTFTSVIHSSDERLKLWIDNSILIDQWSSLRALDVSGTIGTWVQNTYYSVQLQYKEEVAAQNMLLKWTVPSETSATIPSTSLFTSYHAEDSPRSIKLYPNFPCASTSLSSGMGLSLVTAGVASYFTVTVKDKYGNLRQTLHDEALGYAFKSHLPIPGLKTVYPTQTDAADGLLKLSYNITTAGSHTLNTFIAHAGGLHGTYYDTEALNATSALAVRTDATIDFSGAGDITSDTMWPGVTGEAINGSAFGVRWRGFIRAPYDSIYTMSMALGSSSPYNAPTNDRLKLWIDNQLVIEQWSSLQSQTPSGTFNFDQAEHLYDIQVDYKHFDSNQQAVLKWHSQGAVAAAACDFSSPTPAPPDYDVNLCGWRLQSDCDSASSICVKTQTKIPHSSTSSSGNANFGSSVAFIGDGDGDGVIDVVVGAPSDDVVGSDAGAIYILLLTTSGALKTVAPPRVPYVKITQNSNMGTCTTGSACLAAGDGFGTALASMGDLDRNGYTDIAVASKSAVFILFMDQDKSVHCYVCPPQAQSFTKLDVTAYIGAGNIPSSVAVLDDLDGNGVVDLAVGYDGASDGEVTILFLSMTGCANSATICFTTDSIILDQSGTAITQPSAIEIINGASGFTETCVGGTCKFGSSVASIGDVNGDSVPDLAVGAKADDCGGTDRGALYILLMNRDTWTVQKSVKLCVGTNGVSSTDIPNDDAEFGSSVASAGDVNGDGIPDLIVGAPKDYVDGATIKGAIYWLTLTKAGTVLATKKWGGQSDVQVSQTVQGLGMSLTTVKDLDRDGLGDVISGVGWDASYEGAVTTIMPSSWSKWRSGGSPVGGTPTAHTGPSAPSIGASFFYYATGIICNDGTIFKNYAGNTLGGEYSYIFDGTDSACATRCANDELCNFYTLGASFSCKTYRTCWRQDTDVTDASAITYRKGSYLFLEADSMGTNAAPGYAHVVTPPDDYAKVSFYYHMYGANIGTLSLHIKSKSVAISSGVVSAMSVASADSDGDGAVLAAELTQYNIVYGTSGIMATLDTNGDGSLDAGEWAVWGGAVATITLDTTAPATADAWVGKLIEIGGETKEISAYTYDKKVSVSIPFLVAPTASSSKYVIYEKQTRCADKNACRHQNDWSSVWSLSGQQHLTGDERWKWVEISFYDIARPIEVRFTGIRGSEGTASDIAIDRIVFKQFTTPTSQSTGQSKTTENQIVPSNRLYMGYHTANSPFSLTVRSADTSAGMSVCTDCATQATMSAAAATTYSITLKDAYNNLRTFTNANEGGVTVGRPGQMYATNHEDGLVVFLESATNPNERLIADTIFKVGSVSTYDSDLTPGGIDQTASSRTFAGSELKIRLSRVGGLNATYHRVINLAFPVFERVDSTIDFSFTQRVPGAPAIMPTDFFSVRWKGFLRPPTSETWTFKTTTLSSPASTGKEGVRLWLSGLHMGELALVVDRWDGLDAEYTGTLSMLAEKLYEIQMEYKDTYSSSKVQLMWKSASSGWTTYGIVPSDRLYYDLEELSPTSPMTVTVTA